jgi:hypothetical protein
MAKKRKPEPAKPHKGPGRPSSLTPKLAKQLQAIWQLASDNNTITDAEACACAGITEGQLRQWLLRNVKVEVEPGHIIGIRDIRARARGSTKVRYMQTLVDCILKAKSAGDFNAAVKGLIWILPKQFRREFDQKDASPADNRPSGPDQIREALAEAEDLHKVKE